MRSDILGRPCRLLAPMFFLLGTAATWLRAAWVDLESLSPPRPRRPRYSSTTTSSFVTMQATRFPSSRAGRGGPWVGQTQTRSARTSSMTSRSASRDRRATSTFRTVIFGSSSLSTHTRRTQLCAFAHPPTPTHDSQRAFASRGGGHCFWQSALRHCLLSCLALSKPRCEARSCRRWESVLGKAKRKRSVRGKQRQRDME